MRFGRKRELSGEETASRPDAQAADEHVAAEPARKIGPWDAGEVELPEGDEMRVDLGALLVKVRPGIELQLQVDEATQQVVAALLVAPDGAIELRPFAAPRHESIWADVRKHVGADTARRGGTATEVESVYGTAMQLVLSSPGPDGRSQQQETTMLGIEGPRWLLRASLLGRPAVDFRADGELESALQDVVVVRGNQPMAPGEALRMVMPTGSKPRPQD